jgi:hypothetical protein
MPCWVVNWRGSIRVRKYLNTRNYYCQPCDEGDDGWIGRSGFGWGGVVAMELKQLGDEPQLDVADSPSVQGTHNQGKRLNWARGQR